MVMVVGELKYLDIGIDVFTLDWNKLYLDMCN